MKVRSGFVSNSSSISFCIAGICGCNHEITGLFNTKNIYDLEHILYSKNSDIIVEVHPDRDDVYVGIPISKMRDDETKKQFLDRAQKEISKLASKEVKVKIFTDGWYDG